MKKNYRTEWICLRSLIKDDCERIRHAELFVNAAMQGPSTKERGQKIAQAMNQIQIARHSLLHFGLGIPLNKLP
jgi:hypothetical protein